MVRPSRRREMAKKVVTDRGVCIRVACQAFRISESCYRYERKLDVENDEVANWLQATARRNYLSLGAAPASAAKANVHRDIVAFALEVPEAVDWTVFSVWLSLLLHVHGPQILRVKGLLNVEGADAPVVVHGVQQLVHPPSHLERWPSDDHASRLVFIVRALEPQRIQDSLSRYLRDFG